MDKILLGFCHFGILLITLMDAQNNIIIAVTAAVLAQA